MSCWERDKLLMELPKFSFKPLQAKRRAPVSSEFKRYQEFYDCDFSSEKGLKQSIGWFDGHSYRIVLQCYLPVDAKATVFLFHGYFDHVGLYRHLIRFLLEHQFAVVAYDMPGHGLSSGGPTSIPCFSDYQHVIQDCLNLCRGNMPEPFHCVGQSTGGAVLTDYLSQSISSSDQGASVFDKVVLLAPLVRPKDWTKVKRIHTAVKPFLSKWPRSFANNSNDSEFVDFVKNNDPLQSKWMAVDWVSALREWIPRIEDCAPAKRRILIVQGTNDQTVDWQHNLEVLRKLFVEVKVAYINEGRHHLVNEAPDKRIEVFNAMLSELEGQ